MTKRRRRIRRRITAPVRRISVPKKPVAVIRSMITPRIGLVGQTQRRSKKARSSGKIPSNARRAAARSARSKSARSQRKIGGIDADIIRAINRNSFTRHTPCTRPPSQRRAGLVRQAIRRGEMSAPASRMYFHPWCGSEPHQKAQRRRR